MSVCGANETIGVCNSAVPFSGEAWVLAVLTSFFLVSLWTAFKIGEIKGSADVTNKRSEVKTE